MPGENAYQGYWRVYGGLSALLRSSYLWLALVLTVLMPEAWKVVPGKEPSWVGLTLSIMPSLLGFALGGMAIMLSFSSGKFLEAIRQKGKDDSFFLKMMASFFHFALVLSASLVMAFLGKSSWLPPLPMKVISFVGFFASMYGVLLVMATVSSVWHTARIFNAVRDADS